MGLVIVLALLIALNVATWLWGHDLVAGEIGGSITKASFETIFEGSM